MTYNDQQSSTWDKFQQMLGLQQPLQGPALPTPQQLQSLNAGGAGANIPTAEAGTGFNWFDSTNPQGQLQKGALGTGATALSGLAQAWLGFQNLNQAKDQLAFQKDSFNKQYDAQKTTTNTALADRQARRVAASPTTAQDVTSYLAKNAIK